MSLVQRVSRVSREAHGVVGLSIIPWLVLLGWLASFTWFLTDDAFISFRYVRNLLEGHGLVFNRGEYVEGYTNFLWVFELAAIWGLLEIRPEDAAQWLSVIYTAGTIAVMLWWVARMPSLRHRGLVAWMALGLICSSATFAVWTSGGGLETRQFTFFALAAAVLLGVHGVNRWGQLAASLSLAAAALTRPEGLLLAACCVGWFVVQRLAKVRRPDWRGTLALTVPFAVLIGGHFLARHGYYGDWLPNTYYAKHVRPWYESGFRYLWPLGSRQACICWFHWCTWRCGPAGESTGMDSTPWCCFVSARTWPTCSRSAGTTSNTGRWISTGRCWPSRRPRASRSLEPDFQPA